MRAPDLLLDGLAVRYTDGYAAGAPMLKQALRAFRRPDLGGEEGLRWLWFASTMSVDLLEDETWDELTGRFVELARDSGALATLPMALTLRIVMEIFAGDLAGAASLLQELGAAAYCGAAGDRATTGDGRPDLEFARRADHGGCASRSARSRD
jgi:hypothetical protein